MSAETRPDLCHGIDEIAEHLGLSKDQCKHLHQEGRIPTFRIGRSVCALRSKLDAWLQAKAAEGDANG